MKVLVARLHPIAKQLMDPPTQLFQLCLSHSLATPCASYAERPLSDAEIEHHSHSVASVRDKLGVTISDAWHLAVESQHHGIEKARFPSSHRPSYRKELKT